MANWAPTTAPALVATMMSTGIAGGAQGAEHADVGERAHGATAEREPDRCAGDEPRQPAEVVRRAEVDVVAAVDVARPEPAIGARGRALGRRFDDDEVPSGPGDRAGRRRTPPSSRRVRVGRRAGAADEQHQVGLADALQAPRRGLLVGEEDEVAVARLELAEVELHPDAQRGCRIGVDRAGADGWRRPTPT